MAPVATLIVKEVAVESKETFNPGLIEYETSCLSAFTLSNVLGFRLLNFKVELVSNVIIPFEKTVSALDLRKSMSAKPFKVWASVVPPAPTAF